MARRGRIRRVKGSGVKLGKKKLEWARYITSVGEKVARIAIHIRGKPSKLDMFSLGVTALNTVLDIANKIEESSKTNQWEYFRNNGLKAAPRALTPVLWPLIDRKTVIEELEDEEKVHGGYLSDYKLQWLSPKNANIAPLDLYYPKGESAAILEAASKRIWEVFGMDNVLFTPKGLEADTSITTEGIRETQHIEDLSNRVRLFQEKDPGSSRSYLLIGHPGVGKSTAASYMIAASGGTSLRLDLGSIEDDSRFTPSFMPSMNMLIRMLKPDYVVIDDMDRIHPYSQPKLLALIELILRNCKLLFVTVNDVDNLILPLLRPYRLDDHVTMTGIDERVIRDIVPDIGEDVINELRLWPIAYVLEYSKRLKVLGRDHARKEMDELKARVAKTSGKDGIHLIGAPEPDE